MTAQLAQILKLLDRDDIAEIALQTGKPVMARMAGEFKPVSQQVLTTPQIEAIIAGTDAAMVVPRTDGNAPDVPCTLFAADLTISAARRGDVIQLRFARAAHASGIAMPPANPGGSISGFGQAAMPAGTFAPPPPAMPPAASPAAMPVAPPPEQDAAPTPPPAAAPPVQAPRSRLLLGNPPPDLLGILRAARGRAASDVHIMTNRPLQMRCAGLMQPWGDPMTEKVVESILHPLMQLSQRELLEKRGYTDLAVDIPGGGRCRVNISRQKTGLKGSFRLVMEPLPTIESLELPVELKKITNYHQGLVVIAGPNGHGKTTTLAALVDLINSTKRGHILTVEEPVEFLHPRKLAVVSQREVGIHTRSFATALKASLREDPDVIVIGELRDRETVEIAISAAETGHLVIATMSTPSGAKTIDRLIDFFPPNEQQQIRFTLAAALKFVIAQRLVPNKDNSAFIAAVELISGCPPLWTLIRDNKLFQLPNVQQRGRSLGMIRLDESLMALLKADRITEETALAFAEQKKEFLLQLRGPAPVVAAPQSNTAQKMGDMAARARGMFGKKDKEP
ncbi:MAG: PilT/PilU family type 4a pilus ATPase [Myxococcales bacterium]|nr:PilT/PilU family type 4a pilus ATPase [Myxococcales bacterium]